MNTIMSISTFISKCLSPDMIYNHINTVAVLTSDEDQLCETEASFHYSRLTSASPRSFMVPLFSVTLIDTGLMISAAKPRWLLFTRITASIPFSLYWLHPHPASSHTHLNVSDLPLCTELNNATVCERWRVSLWLVIYWRKPHGVCDVLWRQNEPRPVYSHFILVSGWSYSVNVVWRLVRCLSLLTRVYWRCTVQPFKSHQEAQ